MRAVRVVLACVVFGMAAWVSLGVLDEVLAGAAAVRLALLPPWQSLVGFVILGGVLAFALGTAAARPRRDSTAAAIAPRHRLSELVLPAFALALLLVPFVPVLPDRWRVLQVLAGPFRWLVWLAFAGQALWIARRVVRSAASPRGVPWVARRSVTEVAIGLGVVSLLAYGAAAWRLTGTVLFPSGDEPHYLVIAQSLWRDGDLKIENQHQREDYREYFPQPLDPHYLTRGSDGEIYSVHPIGLPVLIAPVYALGGYHGVVFVLVLAASLAAALAWRWVALATAAPGAATLAWAAVALSAPFVLNTFTVYPEIVAALAAVLAFTLAVPPTPAAAQAAAPEPRRRALARWLAVGVSVAALPWLSTKYAPMSGALAVIALARAWWPEVTPSDPYTRRRHAAAVLAPYLASLAAWFAFFYAYWGTPLPSGPYGALVQTSIGNTVFGVPGLLFDQEYGLLPYAPACVLAAGGVWTMLRAEARQRRLALETVAVFGALLGTVGAFRIWWGGSASPGRPFASGLLLLMLPVAVQIAAAPADSARRAAQHLLVWLGFGITVTLVVAQNGLLLANDRDGTSSLLEWLSPRVAIWTLVPTFTFHEAPTALLHSAAWLLLVVAAAWLLRRLPLRGIGGASLTACLVLAGGLLTASLVMPRLPHDPPQPEADLRTRARLPALDSFDAVSRPLAVVYDPLRVTSATTVETLLGVEVVAGTRRAPQPVRVLHNGRFSLPAGEYEVAVTWADRAPLPARSPVTLGLQVGRIGPVFTQWAADATAGGTWRGAFTLPADAAFVGFRGSSEAERSIARIEIDARRIVDAGDRPRIPPAGLLGTVGLADRSMAICAIT